MRIGFGFDLHRLKKGDSIILGGLRVKLNYAVVSHSDGDVILHSLSDAILGAIGEGDTGRFFPPGKSATKGISSRRILKYAIELAAKKGFRLHNCDITIIFEGMTLKHLRERIKKSLEKLCKLESDSVNVKAKTMEGLGDIGKKEAIACYAVALMEEI